MHRRHPGAGPFGLIIGLVISVFVIMFLFSVLSGLYRLIAAIAPFLLIAAAIINFQIIKDYVNMVFDKLKNNIPVGLLYVFGSVFLFPLLTAFLFYRAITSDKKKKETKKRKGKGEYIPYEEVKKEDDAPLDFDKMRQQRKSFEELFDEKESQA